MSSSATRSDPAAPPAAAPDSRSDAARLLGVVLAALGARDGVVWNVAGGDRFLVLAQSGLGDRSVDQFQADWPGHADLLKGVLATGAARIVEARFEPDRAGSPVRELRILLHPLASVGSPSALLEVFLSSDTMTLPDEQALQVVTGLVHAFRPEPPTAGLRSGGEQWAEFAILAHRSLDLHETAYALVAETQRILQTDRVSLLYFRGGRTEALAVSGVDQPDARSAAVRGLVELGSLARTLDRIVVDPANDAGASESLRAAATEFVGPADVRRLALVPLRQSSGNIGLMVLEDRSGSVETKWSGLLGVQLLATSALSHALEHRNLPLFGLVNRLQKVGVTGARLRFVRRLAGLAILGGAIAFLTIQKTTLSITGRGSLVPRNRREVFAPVAGVVESIPVRHGGTVRAGQTVASLRSPALDYEMTRVRGELQTAEQQIADITALRTDPNRTQGAQSSDTELAAREEELKTVRDNLVNQQALLEEQRQRLVVPAPIAGHVLTWDVEKTLEERPVERGQRLMTVGDTDGPWIVEVRIPDRDIGHVLTARKHSGDALLKASFSVTTDLDRQIPAEVVSISDIVEDDPLEGPTVLATLAFSRDDLKEMRPGATAVAKIECGERTVGYVWFRRLIDTVKTWWQF